MDTYKLRLFKKKDKQDNDPTHDSLAEEDVDYEEKQKRYTSDNEQYESDSDSEFAESYEREEIEEEEEEEEEDNFLRRAADDDVYMNDGSEEDEIDDVYFKQQQDSPSPVKSNTKQQKTNGKETKKEKENKELKEEKEEDRDKEFAEFTPSSKKRRVDNTKNNNNNNNKTPPPSISKFSIGTPVSVRKQTPSKNSPFAAYKPVTPSIGILETGFALGTPKRPAITPRKPAITPLHHKALSEQFDSSRNAGNVGLPKDKFPLDFVIKSNLLFTSHVPFDWCKSISPQDQLLGMANIFSSSVSSSPPSSLSDGEMYFAGASFFKFPGTGTPFEGDVSDLIHKQLIRSTWLRDRWKEWEESFSNLYHSFVAGNTSHFYMIHTSFAVLFVNLPRSSSSKVNVMRVIVAKSTRGLRAMLYKSGIPFSMPHYKGEPDYLAPGEDSAAMVELKEMQRSLPWQNSPNTSKHVPTIPFTSSTLVTEGKKEVEQMFQFLLNYQTKLEEEEERREKEKAKETPSKKNIKLLGGKLKQEPVAAPTRKMLRDVPILYSNTPFLNATFKQAVMKSNDMVTRANAQTKLENVYRLELEGPILPTNLQTLCELFAVTQQEKSSTNNTKDKEKKMKEKEDNNNKGKFTVVMKHEEETEGLNTGTGQGLTAMSRVKKVVCDGTPFMLYTETSV